MKKIFRKFIVKKIKKNKKSQNNKKINIREIFLKLIGQDHFQMKKKNKKFVQILNKIMKNLENNKTNTYKN